MELIAEVGSVEDRQNEYYTHFCNWAQSIHHPLDLPDSPFPCIRSVNQPLDFIRAIEINPGLLDKGCLCLVLWHRGATVVRRVIRRRERRRGGNGLIGSPGVWDYSGCRNFFGGRVVSGRYFGGDARRGHVR